jgi:PAS domain-containing protein
VPEPTGAIAIWEGPALRLIRVNQEWERIFGPPPLGVPAAEILVGHEFRERLAYMADAFRDGQDGRLRCHDFRARGQVRRVYVAPIVADGEVLGLATHSRRLPEPADEGQTLVLRAFSGGGTAVHERGL